MGPIGSLISAEYQQVLRDMHASTKWGRHGREYSDHYMKFFDQLGCKSLIDYGSGSETLLHHLRVTRPEIDVQCYDPGVVGRDVLPNKADFVVCTDVLEHIEEQYIDKVLFHIRDLMLIGGYVRCTTSRAKRFLPDGRNAHILQQPRKWWLSKFKEHNYNIIKQDGGTKTVIIYVRN